MNRPRELLHSPLRPLPGRDPCSFAHPSLDGRKRGETRNMFVHACLNSLEKHVKTKHVHNSKTHDKKTDAKKLSPRPWHPYTSGLKDLPPPGLFENKQANLTRGDSANMAYFSLSLLLTLPQGSIAQKCSSISSVQTVHRATWQQHPSLWNIGCIERFDLLLRATSRDHGPLTSRLV